MILIFLCNGFSYFRTARITFSCINIILHVYDNKNASRDILLMNTKITWTEGKIITFFPL